MQAATDLSEELFQEQAGPFRVEIPVLGRVTDVGGGGGGEGRRRRRTVQHYLSETLPRQRL